MGAWDTPERIELRRLVGTISEREIVPFLAGWEDTGELPRELHRKAADAGLLGAGFPEAAGGSGGDVIDALLVAEELIQAGGSGGVIASLFTHGIALPHIVASGDEAL